MTVQTKRININVTDEERELLKRAGHLKYQKFLRIVSLLFLGMVLGHLVRKVVYYDLYEQMLEHNCDSTGYFN